MDRMRQHGAGEPGPEAGAELERSSGGGGGLFCVFLCVCLTRLGPRDRTRVCSKERLVGESRWSRKECCEQARVRVDV